MAESSKTNRLKEARWSKKNARKEYEDEIYTRDDWKSDVANGDTQHGYFDWVIHNLQNSEVDER
jgi:hypothetical protein